MKGLTLLVAASASFAVSVWACDGPLEESHLFLGSDSPPEGRFGEAVDIDRGIAVIGAYKNGPGSVYIFEQFHGEWKETWSATAPDGALGFGIDVEIDGDIVVVGAPLTGAGAAFVYQRIDGQWTQVQTLLADDGQTGDQFGDLVAIDRGTIVVGAPFRDGNAGAAYVFQKVGCEWRQVQRLTAGLDAGPEQYFGDRQSQHPIDGDTIILSAPYGNSENGAATGAAYVFERQPDGQWTMVQKLWATDGQSGDLFGNAVALDGDIAVIGANAYGAHGGAAYIFEHKGDAWQQVAKVSDPQDNAYSNFASAVTVSGSTIVVGAMDDGTGHAYAYTKLPGGDWSVAADQVLSSSAGEDGERFAEALALRHGTLLVGRGFSAQTGAASLFVPGPFCRPDFNPDGALDLFDFLAFVNSFNAGCP